MTADDLRRLYEVMIARCPDCAPTIEQTLPTPTLALAIAPSAPPTVRPSATVAPSPTPTPSPTPAPSPTPLPTESAQSKEERCKAELAHPIDSTFELVTQEGDGLLLCLWVPAAWSDREPRAWQDGEDVIGVEINAALDLAAMRATHDSPGIFYGASAPLVESENVEGMLDAQKKGQMGDHCTFVERAEYDDGVYVGAVDRYAGCNGGEIGAYVIAATSDEPEAMLLLILFVPAGDEGTRLFDEIKKGFFVLGPL